ncbi:hypothetical protein HPB47_020022 [Ixodes persulcatus]|uniref:Uncharacterized protein n=1 Tax=Ixodes persulcatus TaxID=34615 RepID=A0AC60QGN0_IXOPE|nr:hypothetical protein HPB47_020022 [Ixodes persulcatus]
MRQILGKAAQLQAVLLKELVESRLLEDPSIVLPPVYANIHIGKQYNKQVGAMASHMATRLPNPFDSDSCHNSQPVLSLPPAAMFEAMVAPTYDCDEIPDDPASPLSGTRNSPGPSGASPARTTTLPLLPRVRSPSVTQPRPATSRIAALERALAPEKEARVAALLAEEKRKRAQHAIQMRLFRGQLAAQEATQRHQQEMSRLELELFRQRSQLELELLQLDKKLKEKQLAAFTSLPHGYAIVKHIK